MNRTTLAAQLSLQCHVRAAVHRVRHLSPGSRLISGLRDRRPAGPAAFFFS
jgi:hypothetical protein